MAVGTPGTEDAKKSTRAKPAAAKTRVSEAWQRWAAISLFDDLPLADVIAIMHKDGIPEEDAAAVCASILGDKATFEAGRMSRAELHKLESVLDVLRQMRDLSSRPLTVERRSGLTRREFLEEHYAANRPVILEDVCDLWPARGLWTPEYLAETVGSVKVEVMTGRESDPLYEMNADSHRELMAFDKFVAMASDPAGGNDTYLVANNGFLATDAAAPLWDDFTVDNRYFTSEREPHRAFFWCGPAGTVTPLHHDDMNIMFNQVTGQKRFRLVSPLETPYVYNSISVYSDVDAADPDVERYPLYANARPLEIVLEPGDALFLPVGWWHEVESLDPSTSISFTNFVFDNDPEWYELTSPD